MNWWDYPTYRELSKRNADLQSYLLAAVCVAAVGWTLLAVLFAIEVCK